MLIDEYLRIEQCLRTSVLSLCLCVMYKATYAFWLGFSLAVVKMYPRHAGCRHVKQWLLVSFIFLGYFCLSLYKGNKITLWANNPVPQPNPVPTQQHSSRVLSTVTTTTATPQKDTSSKTSNVMVVTSWRSGSTLIGELLNSYPKSFYSYEPLHHLDIRRAYDQDADAKSADKVIKGLLTCNYVPVLQECKDIMILFYF